MRFVLGVLASVCLLSAANAARAQDKPTFVFTGIPDQTRRDWPNALRR